MLKTFLVLLFVVCLARANAQENNYLTENTTVVSNSCSQGMMYVTHKEKIIGVYTFPHNGRLLVEAQDYKNKELTVSLYDSLSAKVFEKKIYISDNMYNFELCRNNRGKYNVKFKVKKQVNTRKVIVL